MGDTARFIDAEKKRKSDFKMDNEKWIQNFISSEIQRMDNEPKVHIVLKNNERRQETPKAGIYYKYVPVSEARKRLNPPKTPSPPTQLDVVRRPPSINDAMCIICNARFTKKENVFAHHLKDHANPEDDRKLLAHLDALNNA